DLVHGGALPGRAGFPGLGTGVAGAWDWWYAPVHAAVATVLGLDWTKRFIPRSKKGPSRHCGGPFCSGVVSSTPLVPARFQASHVIAHPLLAFAGRGLRPDHNTSVHQAHRPGTAGRVGIRPHL